jgi:hypothetical protein
MLHNVHIYIFLVEKFHFSAYRCLKCIFPLLFNLVQNNINITNSSPLASENSEYELGYMKLTNFLNDAKVLF